MGGVGLCQRLVPTHDDEILIVGIGSPEALVVATRYHDTVGRHWIDYEDFVMNNCMGVWQLEEFLLPIGELCTNAARRNDVGIVSNNLRVLGAAMDQKSLIVLARIRVGGGAVDQETRFRVLTGRRILYDAWRARLEDKENDCLFCLRHRSKYVLLVRRRRRVARRFCGLRRIG